MNTLHTAKSKMRGASTLTYTLFLLVTVLVGLEVVLRMFDPIGIVYVYDVHRYFKTMLIEDDRYAYIHAPNTRNSINGEAVRFNSIGLRGPEIPKEKPDGSTRLMILGDSVVLGWGVAEEDMFTSRLQRMFDEADMPIEVVAAGVGSWNTRTEYEFLRHVGVGLAPDVLLLLIVPNDIDPKRDGGYTEVPREELFPPRDKEGRGILANLTEDFWRWAARRSYVAAYLKYVWQEYLDHGPGKPIDRNSPQWRDAQLALDGIIDLTHERGIELIVYLSGSQEMLQTNSILELYDRHLQSRGIQGSVYPKALAGNPAMRISMVDSHFNPAGNELLAKTMFDFLAARFDGGSSGSSRTAAE